MYNYSHLGMGRGDKGTQISNRYFNMVKKIDAFGKTMITAWFEYLRQTGAGEGLLKGFALLPFVIRAGRTGKSPIASPRQKVRPE